MRALELPIDFEPIRGAMPAHHATTGAGQLRELCDQARSKGARLVALWGSDETGRSEGYALHLALALPSGLLWLTVPLASDQPRYPDIADIYPGASRMQRAAADLLGIRPDGNADRRKWLRHGAWPEDAFPLRKNFDAARRFDPGPDRYPFVKVEGDGVHEIPVGPVHAGTIEPGHFRFSVVGEKVLRLEERLGYTHKGVARRFEQLPQHEGHRLAARLSGDAAVAFSWAYCTALESITRVTCPPRAVALRALALELERVANHLGDLGALGNDAGFAFGLTQFSRLKEDLLRANATAFGARYLLDYIIPGGVAVDVS